MSTMSPEVAQKSQASLTAEYINPLILATRDVFEMMLNCTPTRTGLRLKSPGETSPEVSSVIGITGGAVGTVVLGMDNATACEVLFRMLGDRTATVNEAVCDAIGEITNMITGSAKAQLAKYNLSISLPNVVTGTGVQMYFPSDVQPMLIDFQSEIGPFSIEVGFTEI